MIIDNVLIYTEEGFKEGYIEIENDRIGKVAYEKLVMSDDSEVVDGNGYYAVPGLIDMHLHGCNGYDVCDGTIKALEEIARYEASIGVTTIAPATMTLPIDELVKIITVAKEFKTQAKENEITATLAGLNMEGPFISHRRRGAQDDQYVCDADKTVFDRFIEAGGDLISVIGVAPEMAETSEFIRYASKYCNVAITHSDADYDTAIKAFRDGVSHVTHLFNGMSEFTHRQPGILGAVYDSKDVTAELICDGIHIHPAAVRMAFELLGEDRIIMISDSMRATGLDDGIYTLGGQDVEVKGRYARLVKDGSLAGSVTTLSQILKNAVTKIGIPLEKAIKTVTINPAQKLGVSEKCGFIEAGKVADIVLLDKEINVRKVIKFGKEIL